MIESVDVCCPPIIPRLGGYPLELEYTLCTVCQAGPPAGRYWVVRGPKGGVLGAGRTISSAVRIARMVLRERARREEAR